MALYNELPVYKVSYELLRDVVQFGEHMSRAFRYSMHQQLQQDVLDVIVRIYRANRSKDKLRHIDEARERLVEIEVKIRLLADFHQISSGQYAQLVLKCGMLGKQLAAWGKAQATIKEG